jgi:hypothetical protein
VGVSLHYDLLVGYLIMGGRQKRKSGPTVAESVAGGGGEAGLDEVAGVFDFVLPVLKL